MQYSSSFSDVVPPDGMGVYARSPIVVVGGEPIGDESCGGRERCWAWLYGVVCMWVCMLLDQWYKLSLRSMLWSSRGEETDDASDNRSQQGMQIFIKGMTGRTITLTVASDASIEAIKKMI